MDISSWLGSWFAKETATRSRDSKWPAGQYTKSAPNKEDRKSYVQGFTAQRKGKGLHSNKGGTVSPIVADRKEKGACRYIHTQEARCQTLWRSRLDILA